jgi:uncharacterized protein YcbK (DUF882 family)
MSARWIAAAGRLVSALADSRSTSATGDAGALHSRREVLLRGLGVTTTLLLPASIAAAATAGRGGRKRASKPSRGRRKRVAVAKRSPKRPRLEIAPDASQRLAEALAIPDRSLSLYHLHTGEHLTVDYAVSGGYEPECLAALRWLLRDHHTDEERPIDPHVLDLLFAIRHELDSSQPLHVFCGYRSPMTNVLKRLAGAGVAEHSYHLTGQAIDFAIPNRSLRDVHRTAVALRGGGVGYYPRSGFVHVDTGPVRYW